VAEVLAVNWYHGIAPTKHSSIVLNPVPGRRGAALGRFPSPVRPTPQGVHGLDVESPPHGGISASRASTAARCDPGSLSRSDSDGVCNSAPCAVSCRDARALCLVDELTGVAEAVTADAVLSPGCISTGVEVA
jgi:hypothetical protein